MSNGNRANIANIDRLNEFMDRDDLSAVVARSGKNFTYLSGVAYPGTLSRHQEFPDSDRGVIVIWPGAGEPVIVVNAIAAGVTQRDSWVKNLEVYEGYNESPYECLCRVLKKLGLDRTRVGLEKSYLSAEHWDLVQTRLPHLHMVDCTRMMDEVRWVKTDGEIALLKKGADLLDEVYLEVFPTIQAGDTEREIHSRLIYGCLRKGAGWAHGMLNTSTNTVPYCGEGDSIFQRGDVVTTDYVAYLQGYPGHQNRNAVLGEPTPEQASVYAAYREVYLNVIDRCRAGMKACDVYAYSIGQFAKHEWQEKSLLVGHGVGPWWHQQEPVLSPGNETLLEEGMVLAVEPHLDYWSIQDMIVVRNGAPELLSTKFDTTALFVIA